MEAVCFASGENDMRAICSETILGNVHVEGAFID